MVTTRHHRVPIILWLSTDPHDMCTSSDQKLVVFYLETSALMKRYRNEMGTNLLDELFSLKTDSETFVTSSLTLMEANVVLARNLKGNQLRPISYNETVDRIGWDFRDHIVAIPLDDALVEEAMQLLRTTRCVPRMPYTSLLLDGSQSLLETSHITW